MTRPLLVLGGSARQTKHYADEWQVPRHLVRHIFSVRDLLGLEPQPVLRVGNWFDRTDLPEIEEFIHRWYEMLKTEWQEKAAYRYVQDVSKDDGVPREMFHEAPRQGTDSEGE